MPRRILVPLDGSPGAEQAIPVAAHLARQSGGTVLLVRVMSQPAKGALPSTARPSWGLIAETWADIAATYLAHAASHPALADVDVETGVFNGAEAPAILAVARARRADVIVLCTQGSAGAADWGLDWGLDDVALRVIREAEVPVLAVPQYGSELEHLSDGQQRPLRAVVALDGSPHAEAVLDQAVAVVAGLAAPQPIALHLAHVAADSGTVEDGKAYLSAVAHDLRTGPFADQVLRPTWSVVRDREVVRALLALASPWGYQSGLALPTASFETIWGDDGGDGELDGEVDAAAYPGADLIVMATHGLRGPEGWDAERIVQGVLRLATSPVLVVRPPIEDGSAAWHGEILDQQQHGEPLGSVESVYADGLAW